VWYTAKKVIDFKQACTLHDGCKQGIDQQIFNGKSISRKITHPQSLFKFVWANIGCSWHWRLLCWPVQRLIVYISSLPYACTLEMISIGGRNCYLRCLDFEAAQRSHKRSKFSSISVPAFSPSCACR